MHQCRVIVVFGIISKPQLGCRQAKEVTLLSSLSDSSPYCLGFPLGTFSGFGSVGRVLTCSCTFLVVFAWSATSCMFFCMFHMLALRLSWFL